MLNKQKIKRAYFVKGVNYLKSGDYAKGWYSLKIALHAGTKSSNKSADNLSESACNLVAGFSKEDKQWIIDFFNTLYTEKVMRRGTKDLGLATNIEHGVSKSLLVENKINPVPKHLDKIDLKKCRRQIQLVASSPEYNTKKHPGQSIVYSKIFPDTRAIFSGKRSLFANIKAWWNNKGDIFPNLKAIFKGNRAWFANVKAYFWKKKFESSVTKIETYLEKSQESSTLIDKSLECDKFIQRYKKDPKRGSVLTAGYFGIGDKDGDRAVTKENIIIHAVENPDSLTSKIVENNLSAPPA